MKKIYVTQASLPEFAKYNDLLQEIWENKQISNNGPMVTFGKRDCRVFRFGSLHTNGKWHLGSPNCN